MIALSLQSSPKNTLVLLHDIGFLNEIIKMFLIP